MPGVGAGVVAARWQLAILVGAPIAIGLGYLWIRSRRERTTRSADARAASKSAPVSLDEGAPSDSAAALDHALRLKVQGNKAFHATDYEEAIALYDRAIAACPPERPRELATFYQNRSACHEKRERWDLVKRDCTEALRLDGRYVRAFLRRARAAEKSGDLAMALEDVTAACILEQFKVRTTLLTADRVLKALGKRRAAERIATREPTVPPERFVRAYLSSYSRDPVAGAKADRPGAPEGAFERARAALAAEKYAETIARCEEEVAADGPRALDARLLRATLGLVSGDRDSASADLTAVIESKDAPERLRVNALVKRATLHLQADDVDACEADFREALELAPNDCDLRHHRGQALMVTGRLYEAWEEFSKAVELAPDFAVAHVQKWYTQYNAMKLSGKTDSRDEIATAFEDLISRFPDYQEAYLLYAEIESDRERYERAIELFDRALEIDPKNANVYVHKAILHLKMSGDVDSAVELIAKAIEIDDKCLFAYETLGTIEVQRDNLKKAISLFDKAIPLTRTETEMTHVFSLRDAAAAQLTVAERWGLNAPTINSD